MVQLFQTENFCFETARRFSPNRKHFNDFRVRAYILKRTNPLLPAQNVIMCALMRKIIVRYTSSDRTITIMTIIVNIVFFRCDKSEWRNFNRPVYVYQYYGCRHRTNIKGLLQNVENIRISATFYGCSNTDIYNNKLITYRRTALT